MSKNHGVISALPRNLLFSIVACCMLIGPLATSPAYVLSPREANLNAFFGSPGEYVGEDGQYVDVMAAIHRARIQC